MPHKLNAERRHRIPKMQFKVRNWAEYEAGLRRRGSLTTWITPEAIDGWGAERRTTRGGALIPEPTGQGSHWISAQDQRFSPRMTGLQFEDMSASGALDANR